MPLNGDTQLVIDTMQRLHDQNREDILVLFKKVDSVQDKVGQLPCGEHVIKFDHMQSHINNVGKWRIALVVFFLGVLIGGYKTATAYGRLTEKVNKLSADFEVVYQPYRGVIKR